MYAFFPFVSHLIYHLDAAWKPSMTVPHTLSTGDF